MIHNHITGLIQKAIETGLIEQADAIYTRNQVMSLLHVESYPENADNGTNDSIPNLLEKIVAYANQHNVIGDIFDEKEILKTNIMNCFIARPSIINETFYKKYEQSPRAATNYFYSLSKNSNYIQMNRIAKNVHFKADTVYGKMDLTINLSKPEKDPEQIRREREKKLNTNYPRCLLCVENEGYAGRTGYPARGNHRLIHVPLEEENWYMQYSPYVYYNEHSIILAEEHRDMKIDKKLFERLLTFIDKFPHYFVGSNADLPIVGGSILSHDHYQAGHYEFAMTRAADAFSFTMEKFPATKASVLKWPMSVIRLQSSQKEKLLQAADYILQTWKSYSDEDAGVRAFTGNTPHNSITPIARIRDGKYELDLVLRNNRTSEECPFGIFHPHADVHHIKKENIGLIEVMGLAVFPARLKNELAEIKKFLLSQLSNVASYHQQWAKQLKHKYSTISDPNQIDVLIEKELGEKFVRILEDAGVFKEQASIERFINTLDR